MVLILILFSLYYVDQPYIKVPGHGIFNVQLRFGPGGEILGSMGIGLWNRLGIGVSYGASNLIGAGNPEFYEQPGAQIRILAIEPGILAPMVVFGFDNQGYGNFDEVSKRYTIMSKGLYVQVGKTFMSSYVNVTPSLGINYSFEQDGRWDMFMAIQALLGYSTAFLIEYSPNFDDPNDNNKGYLNLGLRFIFYEELFFEFSLRDLLDNSIEDLELNRIIKIGYEQSF